MLSLTTSKLYYQIAKRTSDVMTRTNKLEWWMILKISLRAKAGVPKTLVKRKLRLHSLYFPQNMLMLTESRWNLEICNLFLDFVHFAITLYIKLYLRHRNETWYSSHWIVFYCWNEYKNVHLCNLIFISQVGGRAAPWGGEMASYGTQGTHIF